MATINYAPHVTSMSGKVGQGVHSSWKGMGVFRSMSPSIANPRTHQQEVVRTRVSHLSDLWSNSLTVEERALWEEFSQHQGVNAYDRSQRYSYSLMPRPGRLMSGYNSFIGVNVLWYIAGARYPGEMLRVPPITGLYTLVSPCPIISRIDGGNGALSVQTSLPFVTDQDIYFVPWLRRKIKGAHAYAQIPNLTVFSAGDPSERSYVIDLIRVGAGRNIQDVSMSSIYPFVLECQFMTIDNLGRRSYPTKVYEIQIVP